MAASKFAMVMLAALLAGAHQSGLTGEGDAASLDPEQGDTAKLDVEDVAAKLEADDAAKLEEHEKQLADLEQLDEQAAMVAVRTSQTIADFSDVVNGKTTGARLQLKYAAKQQALQALESAMNTSADSCQDFYSYACGGWMNHTDIPEDSSSWSRTFSTIHKTNMGILRDILNGTQDHAFPATQVPADLVRKVRRFYASCANTTQREVQGLARVGDYVTQISSTETLTDLMGLLAQLEVEGLSVTPFGFGVGSDDTNPRWNVGFAGQGGLGLPDRAYYLNSNSSRMVTVKQRYSTLLQDLFSLVGYEADPNGVLEFETSLASISLPRKALRDPIAVYNPTTLGDWIATHPFLVPFIHVFNQTFDHYGSDAKVVVEAPEYFQHLATLINNTDIATLQAYTVSRVLIELLPYTTEAAGDLTFGFYGKILHGIEERPPLWKRCVSTTQGFLWQISDRLFIERAFNGDSVSIANTMIDYIMEGFTDLLKRNTWMDATTKTAAKKKLDAMGRKVGFPAKWENYESIQVSGHYLDNILNGNKFQGREHYERMGAKVDGLKWHMHASTVNAYYSPNQNEMAFPAGILQPPFFSKDSPMAINFGSIGAVMGHELTHGFDDQGAQYNADGVMHKWWTEASERRFNRRTKCYVDQYEKLAVPGLPASVKVNGKLTLGENMADNGGVTLAYHGYKKWAGQNGGPTLFKMDGREYTDTQLFLTAYGQAWCGKQTQEALTSQVLSDPHSPRKLRVLGPMQNLPLFSQEYNCQPDSVMNPQMKCRLWEG